MIKRKLKMLKKKFKKHEKNIMTETQHIVCSTATQDMFLYDWYSNKTKYQGGCPLHFPWHDLSGCADIF
jgi:hypothetical protein